MVENISLMNNDSRQESCFLELSNIAVYDNEQSAYAAALPCNDQPEEKKAVQQPKNEAKIVITNTNEKIPAKSAAEKKTFKIRPPIFEDDINLDDQKYSRRQNHILR